MPDWPQVHLLPFPVSLQEEELMRNKVANRVAKWRIEGKLNVKVSHSSPKYISIGIY